MARCMTVGTKGVLFGQVQVSLVACLLYVEDKVFEKMAVKAETWLITISTRVVILDSVGLKSTRTNEIQYAQRREICTARYIHIRNSMNPSL